MPHFITAIFPVLIFHYRLFYFYSFSTIFALSIYLPLFIYTLISLRTVRMYVFMYACVCVCVCVCMYVCMYEGMLVSS